MSEEAQPQEVSIEAVGLYLAEAVQIMGTLETACVHERPDYEPLPRGLLTCGEVCRLVPAVVLLALRLYPRLSDEGVLETIVRDALTTGVAGGVQ